MQPAGRGLDDDVDLALRSARKRGDVAADGDPLADPGAPSAPASIAARPGGRRSPAPAAGAARGRRTPATDTRDAAERPPVGATAASARQPTAAAATPAQRPAVRCVASGASAKPGGQSAQRREAPAEAELSARAAYGWRRPRSASIVAGPMPLIWSSSSTEERPPCSSRNAMMSAAVTGPMPSIVSSCSTVARAEADRRVGGPPAAAGLGPTVDRAGAARAGGHDDLLAVGELRREVDRVG